MPARHCQTSSSRPRSEIGTTRSPSRTARSVRLSASTSSSAGLALNSGTPTGTAPRKAPSPMRERRLEQMSLRSGLPIAACLPDPCCHRGTTTATPFETAGSARRSSYVINPSSAAARWIASSARSPDGSMTGALSSLTRQPPASPTRTYQRRTPPQYRSSSRISRKVADTSGPGSGVG